MFFYEIAILKSPLILIYSSNYELNSGEFVEIELRRVKKIGVILNSTKRPIFKCSEILKVKDEFLPSEYMAISKFISQYYFSSIGDALNLFTPFKYSQEFSSSKVKVDLNLSKAQIQASQFIDRNSLSLLFGDTGSGKTEIYIEQIAKVINSNSSAIMLLPEISLTPQMESRLRERFGNLVEIWHSKVTKKEKSKILKKIYSSEVKLIVGARSSLFLPIKNLALIIVDEEHDDSYKSAQRPRYSARDLAIYFGKILNAKVILGSATPSVSSYYKFPTYRLKGRFFNSKKEIIFNRDKEPLSETILEAIDSSLNRKKQVIVFLPTRANFKYLFCQNCSESFKCPYCSVGMSLHRDRNSLTCHYCGFSRVIPNSCDVCNSSELTQERIGTSEVVNLLKSQFPKANIVKFDRDEIKSERDLRRVLSSFNNLEIDILVGTQMISKGHDYHNVDLAIVLEIDSLLYMSDYRARERAISLLLQIAGRSGRKSDGRVIIQTQNSELFREYLPDYEKLLKDELIFREGLYPPFKRLVRVIFSHKVAKSAYFAMLKMVKRLESFENIEVVGYREAEIFKIANRYRYNILIRADSIKALIEAINISKTEHCEIDIDPVNFS